MIGPNVDGQVFCLSIFSSTFSIDSRPRSSRGLCWRSWTALGAYVGGLGSGSGPMCAVLGADRGLSWRSWGLSWRSWGLSRQSQGQSGRSWKRSGRKVAQTQAGKRSGQESGAYVGGLGPLLGPMLAVLGCSQGLCRRSWERIRAHVGGLGSGSGPKLTVLACLGAKAVGLHDPSQRSGRKVAQTRAGTRSVIRHVA